MFCVFPFTVILTNLPTVFAGKLYLSDDKVVPVLFLQMVTLVNVLPSFEDLHCLYPYELEQGSLVVFLQQLQPMLYVI